MPKILIDYLAVAGAGALGAMSRLAVARLFTWSTFPIGTLVINVTGSLFLGWFMAYIQPRVNFSDTVRLAIATGFIGAYTTFSTFMYETDAKIQEKSFFIAALYLCGSILLGLAAVRAGALLAGK